STCSGELLLTFAHFHFHPCTSTTFAHYPQSTASRMELTSSISSLARFWRSVRLPDCASTCLTSEASVEHAAGMSGDANSRCAVITLLAKLRPGPTPVTFSSSFENNREIGVARNARVSGSKRPATWYQPVTCPASL